MNLPEKIIVLFLIGFIFRFVLELLYPYSAIGFDQMGYYVPMLYTNANPINYFSVGFLYYLIAYSINLLLKDPVWTIKLLDAITSGIFILSLYSFSEFGIKNKYSFFISIIAFFSFQSLILDWSLQRNILAFSIFLFTFYFYENSRKNIFMIILFTIISGMFDPAIIPLEFFWFLYLSFKEKKFAAVLLTIIAITLILIFSGIFEPSITGFTENNIMAFIIGFFVSGNILSDIFIYASLVALLFIPFLVFLPLMKNYNFKNDFAFKIPIIATFIFSSIAVFSFFFRYLIELSVISILFIKDPKKYKIIFSLFIIIIFLISASFISMSNYYPSPYFYNSVTKNSGLNDIVSTSFLQSTVPLNDSKIVVKLFSYVKGNDSMVVSMLYMVSFAYESGINPKNVINTGENYSQFLNDCKYYSSNGYSVYTVWWINNGWYGITQLPSEFKEIKIIGNYALFFYGNK